MPVPLGDLMSSELKVDLTDLFGLIGQVAVVVTGCAGYPGRLLRVAVLVIAGETTLTDTPRPVHSSEQLLRPMVNFGFAAG
jgi:hypothetical protein